MSFLDNLLRRRINGKKLVIIDADVDGLSHFKKKYADKGYEVTTILVTDQDLTAFTGPTGKITNDTLDKIAGERVHRKSLPHLGEANYWASTMEQLAARIDTVQPDLILTDSKFPAPISVGNNVAEMVAHQFTKVPVVLHTARLKGSGFDVERALSHQTYHCIEAPKQGDSVDAIFQRLLKQGVEEQARIEERRAAHPRTHRRSHPRADDADDTNRNCRIQPRR